MSTLQALDLIDFTGGLNLHANQFQVGDNESPRMLNMEIEPGRGFYTRKGWQRWNAADVVAPASWNPRSARCHPLADGSFQIYITNDNGPGEIYAAGENGVFAPLGIPCNAPYHLADFGAWGDIMYIACGTLPSRKRVGATAAPVPTLTDASTSWHTDYTTPVGGTMPIAEHMTTHSSYMFVADTVESGTGPHPNRIRWSHPNAPEDWHPDDFLDIQTGGGRITAIRSFQDHLLIFKTDSLWALYGYDLESWQLVRLSRAVGAPTPHAITQSESATYFFSTSGRNGIFAYDGQSVAEISVPLRPVMESIFPTNIGNVWLGFVSRRLWVSVPWSAADPSGGNSIGVFDPDIGDPGAWIGFRAALGSLRSVIEGSDVEAEYPLAVMHGDTGAACVVMLEFLEAASDQILASGVMSPFFAEYLTNWKHLGKPELRKSWLRTRFLAPRQATDTEIRLDVYWDYQTDAPRRSMSGIVIQAGGTVMWRELGADAVNGFDFKELGAADPSGRGADFGTAPGGSFLGRTAISLGVARAVQLHFSTVAAGAGKPWGFDGIFMKVRERRFTT